MYHYTNIVEGVFLSRPNRFIAIVNINGCEEICHVKNTGRCRELLIHGTTVYLQYDCNPKRKTHYSLIAVQKGSRIINIDSQVPNKVFLEYLQSGDFIPNLLYIKPESIFGNSRFDFYCEDKEHKYYIEVKGVTLEDNNIVMFPDAPTERGTKHLNELIKAHENGYESIIVFIIQLGSVKYFTPNIATDPQFAQALKNAYASGVHIRAFDCQVTEDSLVIDSPVPIII